MALPRLNETMCMSTGSALDWLDDLGQVSKSLCFSLRAGQRLSVIPNSEVVERITWKAIKTGAATW